MAQPALPTANNLDELGLDYYVLQQVRGIAEGMGATLVDLPTVNNHDELTYKYELLRQLKSIGDSVWAGPQGGVPVLAVIAGDSDGAHVVTGISPDDALVSVLRFTVEADTGTSAAGNKIDDLTDLTSEFTISDDDEIDNTDGTDTTGDILLVMYMDKTP